MRSKQGNGERVKLYHVWDNLGSFEDISNGIDRQPWRTTWAEDYADSTPEIVVKIRPDMPREQAVYWLNTLAVQIMEEESPDRPMSAPGTPPKVEHQEGNFVWSEHPCIDLRCTCGGDKPLRWFNVHRQHYVACDSCRRVKWAGGNLISSWRQQTVQDWRNNLESVSGYQYVSADGPRPEQSLEYAISVADQEGSRSGL